MNRYCYKNDSFDFAVLCRIVDGTNLHESVDERAEVGVEAVDVEGEVGFEAGSDQPHPRGGAARGGRPLLARDILDVVEVDLLVGRVHFDAARFQVRA